MSGGRVLPILWLYAGVKTSVCQFDLFGLCQREEEAAALSGRAFGPDVAVVLFDNAAAESKAQTGATQRSGVGSISLLKAIENAFQLFGSNAAALIFDNEANFICAAEV
jgi:hypothetical protein